MLGRPGIRPEQLRAKQDPEDDKEPAADFGQTSDERQAAAEALAAIASTPKVLRLFLCLYVPRYTHNLAERSTSPTMAAIVSKWAPKPPVRSMWISQGVWITKESISRPLMPSIMVSWLPLFVESFSPNLEAIMIYCLAWPADQSFCMFDLQPADIH
eukprot:scaffold505400_cov19-Prasinocladus_malaysianus.AAC.1